MNEILSGIQKYVRCANYLTVAQIFLQDNFLLERPLQPADIKPRLLGHWGSCPGVNFTYAHLNHLINSTKANLLFVLGPGHAFPAMQANLFLENTLQRYYPKATHTSDGIAYISKNFSWPYGFPSHCNPGTPGVILEGGELGYSLSTAYGAILDNPDLIVACLIGDGEAETGPINAAWHLNKFINPATNGAVLPILHLNGYKISGPTIFGRMDNQELTALFTGYGYEPHIVEGDDIDQTMQDTLQQSYQAIRRLQKSAPNNKPKFPMIILKTLKGWTGIKEIHGKKIEGNHLSHQVVLKEPKTDHEELAALEEWLRSYKFEELFDKKSGFCTAVTEVVPEESLAMGNNYHAFGGKKVFTPLQLPPIEHFAEDASIPGTIGSSSMRRAGLYLNEVFKQNEPNKNFRFFSPDETYSNKLDQIFASTGRAFVWPSEKWDEDMSPTGRVIEMLSEHSLQGLAQGYVLTGRHAIFASYEAFIQVIISMADQYAKFINVAREIKWRGDFPSMNYILTSSGWRQEHNGFSHQNPGFIDDMLQRQGNFVNVFFPPDGNTTLVALDRMLRSTKEINILVAGKTLEPRWLTPAKAEQQLSQGVMTWDFASDPDPDIVLAAAGDYLTKEAMAAIKIIKQEIPAAKIRFVNITALSCVGLGPNDAPVTQSMFEETFTPDKPVIINFHGYPQTIKQILFDYSDNNSRFTVHGYIENGSTPTPFDMQVLNETSRYQLAMDAFTALATQDVISPARAAQLTRKYLDKLSDHHAYIKQHGTDLPEISDWQWTQNI